MAETGAAAGPGAPTEYLWRLIYPEHCVVCRRSLAFAERHVCPECRGQLPWVGGTVCPRCGDSVAPGALLKRGCASCRGMSLAFERAVAPLHYREAARELVLRFKLGRETSLAHALGAFLCDALAQSGLSRSADVVVPVPLHWRRLVARGFNQSVLLALEVGDRFGIPVAQGALTRRRSTPSQTTLSRLGRAANVRKAFRPRVASSFLARLWMHANHGADLLGKRVLLIDDVMTTGATANACARALRDAGAREVFVGTAARTHWGAR